VNLSNSQGHWVVGFHTEVNNCDPSWGREFVPYVWGHQESWQVYSGGAQTTAAKISAEASAAELQ